MKKILSALALFSAFATIAVSCSKDDTEQQPYVAVQSVKITPDPASVVEGETIQFKAEYTPENATPKSIEWGSRNEAFATMNKETGVATGVAVGDVQIYVIADGKMAVATLTVTEAPIRVESIELNKSEAYLFVGKYEVLTATVTPDNATYPEVTWTSSDEAVATEGSTVNLTGKGFKTGDTVQLEALAGDAYTAEVALDNATDGSASFEFPAAASNERSYKLSFLRNDILQAEAYLRPDNEYVELPYALGYYLVGKNQVEGLVDDPSMRDNDGVTYRGYLNGKIAEYDPENRIFKVWKKDAALSPFNIANEGAFDFQYTTGVTDISPLFELYESLPQVGSVWIANSTIESIDMTRFPNATSLRAWGDPTCDLNKLTTVNFGTYTDDEHALRLSTIQLERNQITGVLDMSNCIYLQHFSCQDNQIEGFDFGECNVTTPLPIYDLNAVNNRIVELSIENLGQVRTLLLAGNPIERLTLLNNSKMPNPTGIAMQQYVYIFKSVENFSVDFVSAEEATGDRVCNVEGYWWRVFSENGNYSENKDHGFQFFGFEKDAEVAYADAVTAWKEEGPIAKAHKDGVEIICWTYHGEGGPDSHPIDGHDHVNGDPCTY